MASTTAIDLAQVSQALGLAATRVQTVVDLLDAGNTVPFITRYRKDQTGGMDEEQIRQVQSRVLKLRLLAERKQTILRSIDSQGKLTPELAAAIEAADSSRRLEDLYLPYKPKKQTLATLARDRGLEPLADEILHANPTCADLDARAGDFISVDRKVATAADALLGAGHILAEWFSERADLRGKLRAIFERSGKLVSTRAESEAKDKPKPTADAAAPVEAPAAKRTADKGTKEFLPLFPDEDDDAAAQAAPAEATAEPAAEVVDHEAATHEATPHEPAPDATASHEEEVAAACDATHDEASVSTETLTIDEAPVAVLDPPVKLSPPEAVSQSGASDGVTGPIVTEGVNGSPAAHEIGPVDEPVAVAGTTGVAAEAPTGAAPSSKPAGARPPKPQKAAKKTKAKPGKDKDDDKAFRDYFQYSEAIGKVPPHRVLAINRGERAKALRVRIDADLDAMRQLVDEMLIPPGHPHADFLRGCGQDALARLILPSLEREVRRELTDWAEAHAVEVFARNLRNLLLQPPVREARVLAVDPGFKSGCKLVALDQFGNVLAHGVAHIVGSEERRAEGKRKAAEMVRTHELTVVTIGNGTGCRAAEQWVSNLIATDLSELSLAYVVVNEAGASVYSTSRLGREELPKFDATARGAVSIGRRLQDPLSELVKIDPPNIGVGMYQHDIKAKHLRDSLDAVVASCVNYVGVDLNTASPALLRYVSGLNQLTARRVYDYRIANGPFKSRDELKSIQGFGEATFVQAAGFLKISAGENALDATWIHPESYQVAEQILQKLDAKVDDLKEKESASALAERLAKVPLEELAGQLNVGTLTLSDIVSQLTRPGRDPRESLPQPIFKRGILKIDDLTPGMELAGTVLNVVDFGAFIDIGLKDSGLVHISQLANRYVQDPHEVVAVGDIVHVWVLEADKERRRVSLTMIKPGTRRQPEPRRSETQGPRPSRPPSQAGNQGGAGQRKPPAHQRPRGRPSRPPIKAAPDKAPPPKPKPQKKPRPQTPLTQAMIEGKAPLRTFGDLKQFWNLKQQEDAEDEKSQE
ncbi:MAG TPA: Tex-like N-terminal domain-containing protein [Pirellulales bacterium]|nr:Tex-like N-terminal domain-containing protein [Pirellulales bacterium]